MKSIKLPLRQPVSNDYYVIFKKDDFITQIRSDIMWNINYEEIKKNVNTKRNVAELFQTNDDTI